MDLYHTGYEREKTYVFLPEGKYTEPVSAKRMDDFIMEFALINAAPVKKKDEGFNNSSSFCCW